MSAMRRSWEWHFEQTISIPKTRLNNSAHRIWLGGLSAKGLLQVLGSLPRARPTCKSWCRGAWRGSCPRRWPASRKLVVGILLGGLVVIATLAVLLFLTARRLAALERRDRKEG